jgi:hypothetical protein
MCDIERLANYTVSVMLTLEREGPLTPPPSTIDLSSGGVVLENYHPRLFDHLLLLRVRSTMIRAAIEAIAPQSDISSFSCPSATTIAIN